MLKRFESAVGLVVMALALAACQPPEGEQLQTNEGEAQVVVRGLSAYNIDRMVVTARPANISKTLDFIADAGVFSGRLLLPAGTQTLTAEGYAYAYGADGGSSDGGGYDAGYPDGGGYDAGYPDGGGYDAGYADGGYADGGGYDAGPSPYDGGATDAGRPVDGGSSDGGPSTGGTLVATGSADVVVVAGNSTAVTMRIYDITQPPPQGDIGPLIRSMKTSRSSLTVGTSALLEVDAVDLDGDPLSYAWTSSCPASTFSSPFAAATSWTSSASGVCKLSVTVTSRSQRVTESLEVTVYSAPADGGPGEGSVQVNGEYVGRPTIYGLYVYGPGVPSAYISRTASSATLPNAQSGATYTFEFELDYGTRFGSFTHNLESDCGGTVTPYWGDCSGGGYCSARYSWTAPASGSACRLTMRVSNGSLTDSFSVGAAVR
jgi:hypothetical protein